MLFGIKKKPKKSISKKETNKPPKLNYNIKNLEDLNNYAQFIVNLEATSLKELLIDKKVISKEELDARTRKIMEDLSSSVANPNSVGSKLIKNVLKKEKAIKREGKPSYFG